MSRRPNIGAAGLWGGKTDGVADFPTNDLIIAHETRQTGQPGGIGGSAAVGAQGMALEVKDRTGAGFPTAIALRVG
jgi:hypothetical protein